jgi:hypothetical protein
VVGIEVRDDDVADVGALETQLLDLSGGGLCVVEHRADEPAPHMPEPTRVIAIEGPEAGVDKHQPGVGLHE